MFILEKKIYQNCLPLVDVRGFLSLHVSHAQKWYCYSDWCQHLTNTTSDIHKHNKSAVIQPSYCQ